MVANQPTVSSVPAHFPLKVVNGLDIFKKDIPPLKWIVKPILHEGTTLLSGDPKVGKSFLALQIAIAVAGGADQVCGSLDVEHHGPVLYLALDDGSERRIQERLKALGADEGTVKNIDFVYQRTTLSLSEGFDAALEQVLNGKQYSFVVLDTLGAVQDAKHSKVNVYRAEYQEVIKLQKLAQQHNTCLLIVHHTNKGSGNDPVSKASGSHGITGAVDSVWMLSKENGVGILRARPRDWEESQYPLVRGDGGGWQVSKSPAMQLAKLGPLRLKTAEETEVVDLLKEKGPQTYHQIATHLAISPEAARKRVTRMEERGLISKTLDKNYEVCAVQPSPLSTVSELSGCPVPIDGPVFESGESSISVAA
jgi:hypothetical protein